MSINFYDIESGWVVTDLSRFKKTNINVSKQRMLTDTERLKNWSTVCFA